ncbi:MAG: type II toxin-antitoxin system PemK/MazF family toxin [Acidobacteriota bacterium]|nr:type II toxin-antitoxin system PemK/MazF family toxin [Acidobacteriota bacterium]
MNRGDIWWANLPEPAGSGPGYRRPVLVLQSNAFNQSRISTVVVLVITKNVQLAKAPGNVLLTPRMSGLDIDSVVNVSQILTLDKSLLTEYVSSLTEAKMAKIEAGVRLVLDI